MTTENTQPEAKPEATAPEADAGKQEQVVELSPQEQEAASKGWRAQTEWEGDPDKWVPAREFLLREEIFKGQQSLKKQLKDVTKALNDLKGHHTAVKETEYKRALETLKAAKVAAMEEGDARSVVKLDDDIQDVKEQMAAEMHRAKNEAPIANEGQQAFSEWVNENFWYSTNPSMRQAADEIGFQYLKGDPSRSPEEVLKHVSKAIKTDPRFRQMFGAPGKSSVSNVDDTGTSTVSGKRKPAFELTDDERQVMNRFVRTGALTADEYIKQLKQIKGIA